MRRNYRGHRKSRKKFSFNFSFNFANKFKKFNKSNKYNKFSKLKKFDNFDKFEKHLPVFVAGFSILLIICAVIFCLLSVPSNDSTMEVSSSDVQNETDGSSLSEEVSGEVNDDSEAEDSDVSFTLSAVGNISSNASMCTDAFVQEDDEYDFFYIFNDIYRTIKLSDIAIGNLNTNLGDINKGCSPDDLAENLKRVGFDVLSTANNHCLDVGFDGLSNMIDVLNEADVSHIGTYKTR